MECSRLVTEANISGWTAWSWAPCQVEVSGLHKPTRFVNRCLGRAITRLSHQVSRAASSASAASSHVCIKVPFVFTSMRRKETVSV